MHPQLDVEVLQLHSGRTSTLQSRMRSPTSTWQCALAIQLRKIVISVAASVLAAAGCFVDQMFAVRTELKARS